MKKNLLLLSFLCLISYLVQGQEDTLIVEKLSTVTVVHLKQREGVYNQAWNQKKLAKVNADNLSDLLAEEGSVFIKSYGLNSLATSSIRGGNAGQTLVLWNGLPIQSPMLGLLDLSLLPMQSAEEVTLTKGGNSALWGSGAIGGILSLKNKWQYSNKPDFKIGTKIGAFGEWLQDGAIRLGNHKFQSNTKFAHHQAVNDFPYRVAPGFPLKNQINNAFSQQNFFQDFYYKINQKHQLAAHFWYQQSDREIPPTIVQNFSQAYQEDQAVRIILDWKMIDEAKILNSKIGLFKEKIKYVDDLIRLVAPTEFSTLIAEFDGQWPIGNNQLLIGGLTHTYTTAQAEAYENTPQEFRTAMFASYRIDQNKFTIQTSLRQTFLNKKTIPIVPNISVTFQANSGLILTTKLSKNYRLPTMNDRFWNPGGNENLLAENGWSQEVGALYGLKRGKTIYEFSINIFNRIINDWILWGIQEGQGFWSANNVPKVWSRGLEPRFSINRSLKNATLKVDLGYDYIKSTNQFALAFPRIAKGEQLIYTPVHQAFTKVNFDYKKFHCSYKHYFTGKSQGINEDVDAYQTASLRLQYNFKYKTTNGDLFFTINNLWNMEYFVIERRPMPGRYWQTGIKLNLNNQNGN